MSPGRGAAATVLLAVLLVGAVGAGLTGVTVADSADASATLRVQNNSTVQQEDPERVEDGGDLLGLRAVLADRLARTLGDSSIELSQGEYDRARELVDAETRSLLDKYVDVAGETQAEGDDENAEQFREAREDQREFVNTTREFYETYEAYQEARENGNTERARRLARELSRLATAVRADGTDVQRSYRTVSNISGRNLSDASAAVEEITSNATEIRSEVETDLFTETDLRVRSPRESVSFTDPLPVEGRLTTANGTAVADRSVRLAVGNRTYTVETNATGRFAFRYRPTTLPLDADRVEVTYQPRATAPYLGSNATLPVRVRQVTPAVGIGAAPDQVGFGDRVPVIGRVGADGVGAAGVPVVVSVGDQQLARTETGPNGTFSVAPPLPATVRNGTQAVQVTVPLEDRALAGTTERRSLTVRTTPANLSVTATQRSADAATVLVRGTLAAAGRGVPSGLVSITVGGVDAGATRTNASGAFATTVDLSATLEAADTGTVTRTVVVRYAEPGTNLGATTARTTLTLTVPADQRQDATAEDGGSGSLQSRVQGWIAALKQFVGANPILSGLIAILVAGGLLAAGRALLWREGPDQAGSDTDATGIRRVFDRVGRGLAAVAAVVGGPFQRLLGAITDSSDESPTPEPGDVGERTRTASEPPSPTPRDVLEQARSQLASGTTDRAVQTGYAGIRAALARGTPTQSHWEFYRTCAANGLDEAQTAALRELTEGYERAAFAPDPVSNEQATAALDAADRVLEATGA